MDEPGKGSSRAKCPICAAPVEQQYRPFCSKRCAEIDLSRWLNGSYAVPAVELDENDLDELEQFVDGAADPFDDDDENDSSPGYGR